MRVEEGEEPIWTESVAWVTRGTGRKEKGVFVHHKWAYFWTPKSAKRSPRTFLSAFGFSRDAARKWLLATPAGASAADLQAPRASWCSVDDREYTYGFVSSRRIR